MRRFRFTAALALAIVGSVIAVAGAAAGHGKPAGSPVVGQLYINNNTTGVNTVAGFDRHADGTLTALAGLAVRSRRTGSGAGPLHRDHCSSAPTAGICSPSTPAATRSRCSGSSPTGRFSRPTSPHVERHRPGEHRRVTTASSTSRTPATRAPTTPGFSLNAGGHLARSRVDRRRCRPALSPATCSSTATARSSSGRGSARRRSTASLVGSDGRLTPAAASPFRPGDGTVRQRVQPDEPFAALRLERAQRRPGTAPSRLLRRR